MIIELIGCSGAGKTALMEALCREPSRPPTVTGWELVLDRPGRRWINSPSIRNVAADVAAVAPFARRIHRHRGFVRFSLAQLADARTTFARVSYSRNVVRRVGMYELAREHSERHVVLDEGPVLMAYHLLVYRRTPVSRREIEDFACLVPAPDWLVYVRAPTSVLVERALSRRDPRRELAGRSREDLTRAMEHAAGIFDALAGTRPFDGRVIVVDNPDSSWSAQSRIARSILAEIHQPR